MNERSASHKFHQFIWPHRSVVLRLAQILTGNAAEAEDLAQETLLKAFKAILTLTDGSNPKAWLMRILRNARIDRLRAARPSAGHLSLDELELDPPDNRPEAPDVHPGLHDPQEVLNAFSDQQMILALQDLPEDIRWTLLLVDVEGMDHKDAAELLDVPLGTIKSRTHRGRAMLRKTLLPLARQMRLVNE